MGRFVTSFIAISLLAGGMASGANGWLTKPSNTWTDDDLRSYADDSPWAGGASVRFVYGARPVTHAFLHAKVLWLSSMPLRRAALRGQLAIPILSPDPRIEPATYRLAIHANSDQWGIIAALARSADRAWESAFLVRRDGSRIAALASTATIFGKDGKPLAPSTCERHAYDPPTPSGSPAMGSMFWWKDAIRYPSDNDSPFDTMFPSPAESWRPVCWKGVVLEFEFPRTPAGIGIADQQIEFVSTWGIFSFVKAFKPTRMIVDGALAL